MSQKLPEVGHATGHPSATHAAGGGASGPNGTASVGRARSRHQRHLATTQRLHAMRSSARDESTLLARVCDLLCESFAAKGACAAHHNFAGFDAHEHAGVLERKACAHRSASGPCPAMNGGACPILVGASTENIGQAQLDLPDPSEGGAPRLLLEVQLSDGEILLIAIDAPFHELGRDLANEDLRDDLAHFEELGRVLVDVLDAERTLTRLKAREAELSSMLGAVPDILTILDSNGVVVGFHNGDQRHLLDASQFIGRHAAELLPAHLWRSAMPVWQRAIATGRVQEHRYTLEHDGHTLHFVSRGQAYGDPVRVLWHTRDITEERRLQEKLLSIQRFEGIALLASALAHDFSNLLTGILGNSEFARIEVGPASPAADALGDVISAARRASDLCQQLLGMSGKRRFSLGFVNLSLLCEEMLVILRTSIGRRVTVVRDLTHPDMMPVLIGDAIQLRQIVLNLLSNASDAIGDEGGIITVRTGIQGSAIEGETQWAYLEVEDSGRGMDELVRRRLLEPFFSVPLEARELGLAATFGIVRGHGGTVEVGAAEAGGTRVRVLLPLEKEGEVGSSVLESPCPAHDEPVPSLLSGGGLVLVVTADQALVASARRALEQAGHRVQHIGSGEEAIIALRAIAGLLRGIILDAEVPGAASLVQQVAALAPNIPRLVLGGDEPIEGGPLANGSQAGGSRPLTADMVGRALARLITQL